MKREYERLNRLTDAELIRRSLAQPDCFGLVFSRHWRSLVETASRWHGPFDAEDVVAETFVRAFESRSLFDTHTHTSALPWLRGIARHVALNLMRENTRRVRLRAMAELSAADETEAVHRRVDAGRLPLGEALDSITPRNRLVLLLSAVAELSHDEISQALGLPPATVRSRLYRARQAANEYLAHAERMKRNPGDTRRKGVRGDGGEE